jgi:phosphoglucosamine mutase
VTRLFGTDGIRGRAGVDLTADLALSVGRAVGAFLEARREAPSIVLGRDTRLSGQLLEAALLAGLLSAGTDVLMAGVVPTPAVAFLARDFLADAGGVISASHNPAPDNGIKFFGSDGYKFSEETELQVESLMGAAAPSRMGTATIVGDAEDRYVAHALRSLDDRRLDGIKVVIDCANGAAYRTSPRALAEAGAEVIPINVRPDGTNINADCGSTHPEALIRAVIDHGADAGLAHDGDADRVIAVDERGEIVDGDAIMAALAIELKEAERLAGDLVVATVMSNLGFKRALEARGIKVIETAVGDRLVLEAMVEHDAVMGGEQSGHVIFMGYSTTGDGLITGLRLLGRMASTGRPLSEVAGAFEPYPQVLINVEVADRGALDRATEVSKAVEVARARLGKQGRVLVRASGTEPVVRVMVEAADPATASTIAEEISEVVGRELA